MPDRPDSTPRLTLGLQVFLLTAGLVVLAVASSVLLTLLFGRGIARNAVEASLERSATVQSEFGEFRLEQLFLRASTVSNDPNFIAYVVESMANQDPASLLDQLDERQRDLGFDFAIVLDLDGRAFVRTDIATAEPEDLSNTALYRDAVDSGEYSSIGIWAREDGRLYSAVLVPLVTSGVLEGLLLAAYGLDDAMALNLREVTTTEVVFLVDSPGGTPTPAATTLDSTELEQLTQELKKRSLSEEAAEVTLATRRYLVTARPIRNPLGEEVGKVLNLGSLDEALAPYRRISNILLGVGGLAVLLALPFSFLLPRRILSPIRRLASVVTAAARGDLDQQIVDTRRQDEVGHLSEAFDSLLSELRETRDMQVYLQELSRTLPDQEKVVGEASPARQLFSTLVGLELRQYVKPGDLELGPRETLDRLARDLRRLSRAVIAHGGQVETASGHRFIAGFEGDRHAERALSAAAELNGAAASGLPVAVVVAAGRAITGTVNWNQRPAQAWTGAAVEELEDLLRAGRPGTLLLSKSAFVQVAQLLQELQVNAQEHQAPWTREPIYSLAPDQASRLAVPEARATMDITGPVGSTTGGLGRTTLAAVGPGNVLGNRFEILSELGAGGMGVVFKARDQELNELVALKMLKQDVFAGDAQGLDNLKAELKMARKISHPNILRTFDFGEADGFPFISMEFVRGVTLKELLEQSGRPPHSAGLHMARQLCRGLKAAHDQSVLHRDIKPENMIIEPSGNVKLMDFGIAQPIRRLKGEETHEGPIVGTPFYLAPEQLEGKEPDERVDIYACGVVLYEIFTGTLPFTASGNNLMQIIGQKMNEDPPPPSTKADIPAGLEKIIMRCLDRDRDRRYQSVGALLEDLENLRG